MSIIIDGKKVAQQIREKLKTECEELKKEGILPKLAVIMIGDNPASKIYIKNKNKACKEVGIEYEEHILNSDIAQEKLINLIETLNNKKDINGILLQSPIPSHLDINEAFRKIAPEKDVDGFNPINAGKLIMNQNTFVPCTPYGVMRLLDEYNIDLQGKNVVILGRSNIVGKPLISCCLNKNATVTVCHSKTENIEEYTKKADVLIVAIGNPKFITKEMIKKDVIIIDIGINRTKEGKIVGDVDFEEVKKLASYITPVPGGVGPMTIAMLMNNVIKATRLQNK